MASWQKVVLAGLSAGAGFALTLLLTVGIVRWYRSHPHPKPWNEKAIQATFDHLGAEDQTNKIVFYYVLANQSDLDYQLANQSGVFLRRMLGGGIKKALDSESDYAVTIDYPVFIPAKQRILVNLHVPDEYKDPCFVQVKEAADKAGGDKHSHPKRTKTIGALASRIRQKFTACKQVGDRELVWLAVQRFGLYQKWLSPDELQKLSGLSYPDEEALENFVRTRMRDLSGFALFDEKHRYEIVFRKSW